MFIHEHMHLDIQDGDPSLLPQVILLARRRAEATHRVLRVKTF